MSSDEKTILVKLLIKEFLDKEFEIMQASIFGFEDCMKIGNSYPDIMAEDSEEKVYLGLVKKCKELDDPKFKDELEDLTTFYYQDDDSQDIRVPLYVASPQECVHKLKQRLSDFGLVIDKNLRVLGI